MQFNKEQLEVINHKDGACVVIAGAGSGKSTVLTYRIKNLIDTYGVNQEDILAISFTRNTADDLKKKLNELNCNDVNVGTFHKICGQILQEEGINTYNKIKEWECENEFKKINPKPKTKDIMSFISYQKNCNLTYNDDVVVTTDKHTRYELIQFYKAYEELKQKKNAMDYDDLLIECSKVNKNSEYIYKYLLVDEHQDCNIIKNILIKQLCPSGNIFVVGDHRQSIYGFTGSQPSQFMYFYKEFPNTKVINLDINYRSNETIVNNANKFIAPYFADYEFYSDSKAESNKKSNVQVFTNCDRFDETEEVGDIIKKLLNNKENPNEIAILYRLNSHSINLETYLRDNDIDYEISNNGSFFKRKEIGLIMSVLRLVCNPHDDGALDIIFKEHLYPLKFFSNVLFGSIREYSGLKNISFFEALRDMKYKKDWEKKNALLFIDYIHTLRLQKDKNIPVSDMIDNIIKIFQIEEYLEVKYDSSETEDRLRAIDVLKTFTKGSNVEGFIKYIEHANVKKKKDGTIKLMSIHKSKGLEFKHVFVIGIEDGKFPHEKSDVLEEARLFYVAITRPKENLYLSQIGEGNRFVDEYIK